MKRHPNDDYVNGSHLNGPPYKKQRTMDNDNDNNPSHKLNTAGWGISDSDSDDDDDNNNTNTNNTNDNTNNNASTNASMNASNNVNVNVNGNVNENGNGTYSGIAHKLMKRMGYIEGKSLGKDSTSGIIEPISAYNRIASRGGLGFESKLSNFKKNAKHEYVEEKIEIEVKPSWYNIDENENENENENKSDILPTYTEFESYLKFKKRVNKVGIEWNDTFCSIEIQREIFSLKSEFDEIGQTKLFVEARNKANPFEGIKREIFQNRAALKMCEIDRILNYLITAPYNGSCITFNKECKKRQEFLLSGWKAGHTSNISLHDRELWTRELIYFSDLCSGPGGFTEYFLHINKWQCRGWGFTLRGNDDFKLTKFNSNAPWDNFTPEYGPKNNGDICDNDNLIDFRNKVVSVSMEGCHIVMSDGGFDCFPDYNSQELLSRQLILCQFLCAMSILRQNGIFVCKLFDCFHPFTASIIYIASMCFNKIGLIKPNQSRPANSERYIICEGYKFGKYNTWNTSTHTVNKPHYVIKHLLDINMIINKFNKESEEKTNTNNNESLKEVSPLIPIENMNKSFIKWLKHFNEINGNRQCRHLKRIKKYLEDKTLQLDDQISIRKTALKYWFNTPSGDKFIVLDPQFGCRYITKYEDYVSQNHTINTLITNKELLKRIQFEFNNSISYIRDDNNNNFNDFKKYNIRGDWFSIAFEFKRNLMKYEPKWVTLISTGNRNIFECIREKDNNGNLICISKTNDLMRLPADTVIDCIKIHKSDNNCEIYHIFDCWIIGSKSLYKRNFIQRQEFCRVLYQGYGSKYIKFAGARPALQSIKREYILKNKKDIYLWFIRNKKSVENKEKNNKKTQLLSQYWRPCAIKLWNGQNKNLIPFDKLLQNLKYINHQQMQKKEKLQHHSRFTK